MKYNKIIRDAFENRNSYLISIVFSVLLFVTLCYFGVGIKGTQAFFSGGDKPVLNYKYIITYSSNYPINLEENSVAPLGSLEQHTVVDNNLFKKVPEGYQFVGWNTLSDGTGIFYNVGDVITVESNLYLYAIWELIPDTDNSGENSDEQNPSDDNSDNTKDDGNNTTGNDDNNDGNDKNSSGSGSSSGGSGTSGSGTGNGSSGSVTGGSSSNNVGGGNSSGNSNNSGNVYKDYDEDDLDKEETFPETYEFKFINGESVFNITNCDVLEDGTCKLVYPSNIPVKIGYKFKGWSLSNLCMNNDIITGDIDVDGNRTYYACYKIDNNYNKGDNKWIYLVIGVWIIAGILIYFSIRKFRKNEEND